MLGEPRDFEAAFEASEEGDRSRDPACRITRVASESRRQPHLGAGALPLRPRRLAVYSTPRHPEHHAKWLRKKIDGLLAAVTS